MNEETKPSSQPAEVTNPEPAAPIPPAPEPVAPTVAAPVVAASEPSAAQPQSGALAKVEKITAWILILSGILFALVGLMSIWGAFGGNTDIVWRSLGSLAVIAFTALIVNVGARIAENKK